MTAALSVGIVDPARTRELRRSVLRPELLPGDPLPGDELPEAIHFGAILDDHVVSTCFLHLDPCPWLSGIEPAWHLRQMATYPSHRGRGFAGAVVEAAVAYAQTHDRAIVWLNGREKAIPMYARHGFVGVGEIFIDEVRTIPHLRMWRDLRE